MVFYMVARVLLCDFLKCSSVFFSTHSWVVAKMFCVVAMQLLRCSEWFIAYFNEVTIMF